MWVSTCDGRSRTTRLVLLFLGVVTVVGAAEPRFRERRLEQECRWSEDSVSSQVLEEQLLNGTYDATVRPNAWKEDRLDAAPDDVTIQFYLISFALDEFRQSWTARGYFRSWWYDERLMYDPPECTDQGQTQLWVLSEGAKIWRPDVFGANTRDWSDREKWNSGTWIYPDGLVYDSYYTNDVYECDIKVQDMPWDDHVCSMRFTSYTQPAANVRLLTAGPVAVDYSEVADENIWTVDRTSGDSARYRHIERPSSGEDYKFSEVNLNVHVSRKPRYYILYAMMPAMLLLVIEYVSFWVDREAAPARATMTVVPVLTLRLLLNSIFARVETVSYTIYIAEFLNIAMGIAILCTVEYGVVHIFLYNEAEATRRRAAHRKLGTRLNDHYDRHDMESTRSGSISIQVLDSARSSGGKKKVPAPPLTIPPSPCDDDGCVPSVQGTPTPPPRRDASFLPADERKEAEIVATPADSSTASLPMQRLRQRCPSVRFVAGDPCAAEECDYSNPIHEMDVHEMRLVFDSYDVKHIGSLGPGAISRVMKLYGVYIDTRCARDTMLHFRYVTGLPIPINHNTVRLSFAHFQDFVARYENYDIGRDQRNMSVWSKPCSLQVDIFSRITFFPISALVFLVHYLAWYV